MHPFLLVPAALISFFLGKKIGNRTEATGSTVPLSAASDLGGVDKDAWAEFVSRMETSPRNKISARYKLGAFQMDARRLADVGIMTEARKVSYGPEMGVWMGRWAPGLSEKDFLGSMPLQYAAFVRSVRAAAPKVSRHVGTVVEGKKTTLSGLLGVAHAAGITGVESWIADPGVRRRFASTTNVFHRTNGIF